MVLNCKVSCEVNLSKVRKYKEEHDEKMSKKFTCEICSKSFNYKGTMQRHVKEVHYGKKRYDRGDTPIHQSQQFRNKQFDNNPFGKHRVVKDITPSPIHQRQQQFENNQFWKGYAMQGVFDIRLKENFKLFISGPSRCGKTVFVSKLLENIHTFAKLRPTNVI